MSKPSSLPLGTTSKPKFPLGKKASRVVAGTAVASLAVGFVGQWEGLRLAAYRDIIGVPTVCYGETRGIKMGMKFTKTECDEMLIRALDEFAIGMEACVPALANERATSPQFYVSNLELAYNVGLGAYCKSTLARKVNQGDQYGACVELLKWVKAGGKTVRGLFSRRKASQEMCLRGRS